MKALVYEHLPFANVAHCTVTCETLRELAAALVGRGPTGFQEALVSYEPGFSVEAGRRTHVEGLAITVAEREIGTIAAGIEELANRPDRSRTSFAEMGVLTPESSHDDLEFYLLNEAPPLQRDYVPHGGWGMCEWVLHHVDPTEGLLSEHCFVSGDFQADVTNFLSYREVVASLRRILRPTSITWGDFRFPPDAFTDPEATWEAFRWGLEDHLGGSGIPARVEQDFLARLAEELVGEP